jgi:MGT family glycosyltransferase
VARILVYTSPARGHLFPVLGVALELQSRGHHVHVRTLAREVDRVRALGLEAAPMAREVEAREMDDWKAKGSMQAIQFALAAFGDRSAFEVDDLTSAIGDVRAEALLVDTNSWGAQAAAEGSGLPWATFQPYFAALPEPGVPPFGPGLRPASGPAGRVRDTLLGRMILSRMDGLALPAINAARARLGLDPIAHMFELYLRPPRVLYFTAEPFEYPRTQWPQNFRLVGPGTWAPQAEVPGWLSEVDRPIALVTCSTERQSDKAIIEAALSSLPEDGFFVVATGAAYGADNFDVSAKESVRVEQYLPHGPVVERASVVICHGGMGITQRALSNGVPVVVVPFGRDQFEVARRVEHARAGVRLPPNRLSPASLSAAVKEARAMRAGAGRIAAAFAQAGGEAAAADSFEELIRRSADASDVAVTAPGA